MFNLNVEKKSLLRQLKDENIDKMKHISLKGNSTSHVQEIADSLQLIKYDLGNFMRLAKTHEQHAEVVNETLLYVTQKLSKVLSGLPQDYSLQVHAALNEASRQYITDRIPPAPASAPRVRSVMPSEAPRAGMQGCLRRLKARRGDVPEERPLLLMADQIGSGNVLPSARPTPNPSPQGSARGAVVASRSASVSSDNGVGTGLVSTDAPISQLDVDVVFDASGAAEGSSSPEGATDFRLAAIRQVQQTHIIGGAAIDDEAPVPEGGYTGFNGVMFSKHTGAYLPTLNQIVLPKVPPSQKGGQATPQPGVDAPPVPVIRRRSGIFQSIKNSWSNFFSSAPAVNAAPAAAGLVTPPRATTPSGTLVNDGGYLVRASASTASSTLLANRPKSQSVAAGYHTSDSSATPQTRSAPPTESRPSGTQVVAAGGKPPRIPHSGPDSSAVSAGLTATLRKSGGVAAPSTTASVPGATSVTPPRPLPSASAASPVVVANPLNRSAPATPSMASNAGSSPERTSLIEALQRSSQSGTPKSSPRAPVTVPVVVPNPLTGFASSTPVRGFQAGNSPHSSPQLNSPPQVPRTGSTFVSTVSTPETGSDRHVPVVTTPGSLGSPLPALDLGPALGPRASFVYSPVRRLVPSSPESGLGSLDASLETIMVDGRTVPNTPDATQTRPAEESVAARTVMAGSNALTSGGVATVFANSADVAAGYGGLPIPPEPVGVQNKQASPPASRQSKVDGVLGAVTSALGW